MITYQIVAVGPHHCVIQYIDGVCRGGDHHWLTRSSAEAAFLVYRQHPELHGATESVVVNEMNKLSLTPNQPRFSEVAHELTSQS